MTDLVKRLREYADCYTATTYHDAMIREAANEIERLRAGGCARDQATTQFCAEAQALSEEVARLRRQIANLDGELKAASACEISGRVRERCAKECDIWKTDCRFPVCSCADAIRALTVEELLKP